MDVIVGLLRNLNVIPVPVVDTQSQLLRARAILEANVAGVFDALDERAEGMTPAQVAERCGISLDGATVLLTALSAIGYVKPRNGAYRNSRWVKRWITNPERGLRNYLKLQMIAWNRLEHMGLVLQSGKPSIDVHQELAAYANVGQDIYTRAMRELAWLILPNFLKMVNLPTSARRLLDIGGAHGEYSRALMRRHPGLQATVLDLPGPVESAQRIFEEEQGNPEGVELVAGDVLRDDIGKDWDVVLMINIAHIFDPEQNLGIFRKIREALNQDGMLVITDQFTGLGKARDMLPSLLSLGFFTIGGRCYPITQIQQLLREAGFSRVRLKRSPPWFPSSFLEAYK